MVGLYVVVIFIKVVSVDFMLLLLCSVAALQIICVCSLVVVEDFDKFVADWKMLTPVIPSDSPLIKEHEEVSKAANLAINTGATTRLEFKMCNALLNLEKATGKDETLAAERYFSSKFRLRRDDFVHPSLLKKRLETWK